MTHLCLTGGQQGTLYGGRLDLRSESLEVIDISNSAKELTFERLECPSLREIRCSDLGGYGNGLVPRLPTGSGSWGQERPGPGVCDQPCKFTQSSFLVGSQQPDCPLIDLPEQCVVYWSFGEGEIRATSTTTYGELYDCTGPLPYGPLLYWQSWLAMHQLLYIYAPPRLHPGFYLASLVLAACLTRHR